jgi:hypothetical protein
VCLIDIDGHNFANLALMKLSAYHKAKGDTVEMCSPAEAENYDCGYASKVFTFSVLPELPAHIELGGSAVDVKKTLPDEVEHISPDYSLYGLTYSMGFVTRGCVNKCPWCLVPEKEGPIRAHADIMEFSRHMDVVLMDNNILAHPHGVQQLEKVAILGHKIDINQGLDARLIDDTTARLLARIKWLQPIRLACDSDIMIPHIEKAVKLLRWHNATPRRYSVYVLVKDVADAVERVKFIKGLHCTPFVQPYRDFENTPVTQEQRDFAHWANRKQLIGSTTWEDYVKNRKPIFRGGTP